MRFIRLSEKDEAQFRKSAREKYAPFSDIIGIWHPVYQDECVKINDEAAMYVEREAYD